MSDSSRRGRRHRPWYQRPVVRKRIYTGLWILLGVLLVWFGLQAASATSALRTAAIQAGVLQNQIAGGDAEAAKTTLQSLQQSTGKAHDNTKGPMWDVAKHVPVFGRNFDAVQSVSAVLDDISNKALPPIVDVAGKVNTNTFSPRGGKLDLKALTDIEPSVAQADKALTAARAEVSKIDAGSLFIPLGGPIRTVQEKINTAQGAAASGHLAAQLLPTMLGGDESRRYMLLIQNNAEIRSTGGISGAFAILSANKGKLSMGEQGSIQDLPPLAEPAIKATGGEKAVYASTMLTDIRNVNFTPDFPRTGEITAAIVKKSRDLDVDGVISVDPVALSYVLGGTGPVQLEDGTLLSDNNAVPTLLNKVYIDHPDEPNVQDDIFASAAREIFDAVKNGTGDSRLVISGLVKATTENRLTVWSSRKDEQAKIAESRLSGILSGNAGKTPHVGVYMNDGASTKMEYYLQYYTSLAANRCIDRGQQQITTTTQLTSNAPSNVGKLYVAGDGGFAPRGVMLINVRIYSPYAGAFTRVELDGQQQVVSAARHKGRNVARVAVLIKPGETHVITTTMLSGREQQGDVVLSTTPGVNPTRNNVSTASAC